MTSEGGFQEERDSRAGSIMYMFPEKGTRRPAGPVMPKKEGNEAETSSAKGKGGNEAQISSAKHKTQ